MKFNITFKSPDAVDACLQETVDNYVGYMADVDEDIEREELALETKAKLKKFLKTWVKNLEYITIRFDTDTNTAIVLPRKYI